jgi:S-adenosylmethionine decarboxylase
VAYGKHLLFEAYGLNDNSKNMELIYKWLKELPGKINMEILFQPCVHKWDDPKDPLLDGISGVVGLTTSHASLHFYPYMRCDKYRGVCFVDIFSCKDFDEDKAIQHFNDFFESEMIHRTDVGKRGIYFKYDYN